MGVVTALDIINVNRVYAQWCVQVQFDDARKSTLGARGVSVERVGALPPPSWQGGKSFFGVGSIGGKSHTFRPKFLYIITFF